MSFDDIRQPRLDSDLLRTFLAVAKEGTVSRGADRLFRTQSAVSLQLRKLEDTVGQQLFQRHGRGVTLTTAGEKLLPTARRVVSALDQAIVDLRSEHLQGEIRIAIPDEYGEGMLASILAGFSTAHPKARITVRCGSSIAFPELVAAGEIDIALHSTETASPEDLVVHREAAVWAGSAFHELGEEQPLPVALFDKACWWRSRSLELLDKSGMNYRIACTSESVAGVRAAIVSGIAIGVLPEISLTSDLRVLSENPALPSLGDSVLVLTRRGGAPKNLAEAMSQAIFAAFRETRPARASIDDRAVSTA